MPMRPWRVWPARNGTTISISSGLSWRIRRASRSIFSKRLGVSVTRREVSTTLDSSMLAAYQSMKGLVSDGDLLRRGDAGGIRDTGGDESDFRGVSGYRKRREHLESAACLRGAEILAEGGGGIDVDDALGQSFAREVVKSEGQLGGRVSVVESGK